MKSPHKWRKRILLMVLLLLLLCAGGFGFYVSDYDHADGSALAVLDESGITADGDIIQLSPASESNTAIVFYPGAKVEAEAYLPLLDQLRENGFTCFLVKMPFNMAIFDSNAAADVITDHPEIQHWYIAGHSMGGAMASSFAADHSSDIDGLILLGAYIYGDYPDNDTLTIYGSLNESVAEKITYDDNIVVIEGGNHAKFGNYGPQDGDKPAIISAEEQQKETVDAMTAFINQRA